MKRPLAPVRAMSDSSLPPTADEIALLIARLESLVGREGVAEDYVRLRIELLGVQGEGLEALAREAGEPGAGRALLGRVIGVFRGRAPDVAGLRRMQRAAGEEPGLVDELVRSAVADNAGPIAVLTERFDVAPDVLRFIARATAAPLLTAAERQGGPARDSTTGCPACGATPGLASLRPDDGGRVLHCSLCGRAWPFGRLDCPFCGGGGAGGMEKLSVDADPARWIEACRECRRYLKTVDRGQLAVAGPFFPLVEETAGLYLDLLAEQQDWLPNPPYAAVR